MHRPHVLSMSDAFIRALSVSAGSTAPPHPTRLQPGWYARIGLQLMAGGLRLFTYN